VAQAERVANFVHDQFLQRLADEPKRHGVHGPGECAQTCQQRVLSRELLA
jgi:hypothetical protein